MKQKMIILITALSVWTLGFGATESSFTDAQKKQIGEVVKSYLLENPEVLIEVGQALKQKQQQAVMARAKAAIPEHAKGLFQAKSPTFGKGEAHVVTFFDYQCVHCRKMAMELSKMLDENPKVKVIFKEFPIFGDTSEYASKVALAANLQGKYRAFHDALMKQSPPLNVDKILAVAKKAGLNMKQLKKDIASNAVQQELDQNYQLAQALGIMGTPAFVVAGKVTTNPKDIKSFFVPGATSRAMLSNLVEQVLETKEQQSRVSGKK